MSRFWHKRGAVNKRGLIPDRSRNGALKVLTNETVSLITVRKGKALVPHLVCAEKAEIDKHNGYAQRGHLPSPGEPIAQLIVPTKPSLAESRSGRWSPLGTRLEYGHGSLVILSQKAAADPS
jgi:hypothetical protein